MVEDNVEDMIVPNDFNMQPPEEAHLVLGRVENYFFLVPDEHNLTQKFSKQGMQLWEKYFVPHIELSSEQENSKFLQIPPPSLFLLENNNESASPVL
jgi:hypothetical protein